MEQSCGLACTDEGSPSQDLNICQSRLMLVRWPRSSRRRALQRREDCIAGASGQVRHLREFFGRSGTGLSRGESICVRRGARRWVSVEHASCTWSVGPMASTDQSHPHLVMMVVGGTPASTPKRSKKTRRRRCRESREATRGGKVCGVKGQYGCCSTQGNSACKIKHDYGNGDRFAGRAHAASQRS